MSEKNLANRVQQECNSAVNSAIQMSHEQPGTVSYSKYRDQLTTEIHAIVELTAVSRDRGYTSTNQHVQSEVERFCTKYPQEWIVFGEAYRAKGWLQEAKDAVEKATVVEPGWWDNVAELERELGNEQRAVEIWTKMADFREQSKEYGRALDFARKIGDEKRISRLEELAPFSVSGYAGNSENKK